MYKVLIVDDEQITLQYLRALTDWRAQGFEIVGEAMSGKKAVELMCASMPDVVFLDIRMPQVSGLDLAMKLMEIRASAKIVLLSAYREFDYARGAIALSVFDYLLKHEMNEDKLLQTLGHLRTALEQSREGERARMHTLVSDILEQRGEHRLNAAQFSRGKRFCYLILEADRPVPLTNLPKARTPNPPPDIWAFVPGLIEILDVTRLTERRWGILLLMAYMPSQRQTASALMAVALQLCGRFATATHASACITASRLFDELADLRAISVQLQEGMPLYPLRAGLISGGLLGHTDPPDIARWLEPLRRVAAQVLPDDIALADCLERLEAGWDELRLVKALRKLFAALDAQRGVSGMPCVSDRVRAGEFDLAQWTGLESALAWLQAEAQVVSAQCAHRRSALTLQAIRHIRERFAENVTVEGIAAEIGVSATHIRRVFKEDMGQSIKSFLDDYRIERSCMLLRTGSFHNYELAQMCGFSSAEYFITVFKQHKGQTPQRYMARQAYER